jgi:hypothetical protein
LPINEQANSRKETRTTRHYRMKDQKHKRHWTSKRNQKENT